MEFKKLSAVEMVDVVDQDTTVLIEKDGVIKRAPKNEIGNKVKKELVYEWSFSADDEVYEIYENVDEDLSWLTKRQDSIGFEIVCENYAYQYDYHQDNGDSNYIFFEDIFSTISSVDVPYYARYTNVPLYNSQSHVQKELLKGEIYGPEMSYNHPIDDVSERSFRLYPYAFFDVENGAHCDFDNDFAPTNVENGGCIIMETDSSPFKSVKIYKITR